MYILYCFVLYVMFLFFFFKQKTAYEMRISDWSSDVCSSDLSPPPRRQPPPSRPAPPAGGVSASHHIRCMKAAPRGALRGERRGVVAVSGRDRKRPRLNSSH